VELESPQQPNHSAGNACHKKAEMYPPHLSLQCGGIKFGTIFRKCPNLVILFKL
jgi:hypothetical protein